jgi:hypothetical protein
MQVTDGRTPVEATVKVKTAATKTEDAVVGSRTTVYPPTQSHFQPAGSRVSTADIQKRRQQFDLHDLLRQSDTPPSAFALFLLALNFH